MTRALDFLVGKRLFGYEMHKGAGTGGYPRYRLIDAEGQPVASDWYMFSLDELHAWDVCPHFSSNIAAAWRVVEEFVDFSFYQISKEGKVKVRLDGRYIGIAATAPLAIVLAALRAVGVDEAEIQAALG